MPQLLQCCRIAKTGILNPHNVLYLKAQSDHSTAPTFKRFGVQTLRVHLEYETIKNRRQSLKVIVINSSKWLGERLSLYNWIGPRAMFVNSNG